MENYLLVNNYGKSNTSDRVYYVMQSSDLVDLVKEESVLFGDKAYIVKEGKMMFMGNDGAWYDMDGESPVIAVEELNVTENGTYSDPNVAYKPVKVNVPGIIPEAITITENGVYSESGKAYSPVTVAVPLGTKSITANGTYNASDDSLEGYSSVSVDVPLPENAYIKKDLPTGAIANVTDAEAEIMPSLKVAIKPVQSGSGDPSPDNIRPISGWTECNVTRTGVNVWDEEWEVGGYNTQTGEKTTASNRIRSAGFIKVKAGEKYYINSANNVFRIFLYDTNYNYIDTPYALNNEVYKIPNDVYYITFHMGTNYGTTYNNDISINTPYTDTAYHAYTGQDYSIPFTDGTDPLTVYGGTLDVETGVLTVERVSVTYDGSEDENWSKYARGSAANYCMKASCSGIKTDEMYENANSNYLQPITSTSTWGNHDYFVSSMNGSPNTVYTGYRSITSVDDWTAYLSNNPLQVVYNLATPLTYQLSQTAIKTLLNTNNISADTGDILDGEYWSKNPLTVTRAMFNTLRDAGEVAEITEPEETEETEENADER